MPDIMTKKAHFFTINPLSAEQVDYIKLWAKTNPDYEIIVSGDIKLSLKKSIYKHFFDKSRREAILSEDFLKSIRIRNEISDKIDGIIKKVSVKNYRTVIQSKIKQPELGKITKDFDAIDQSFEKLKKIANIKINYIDFNLDKYEIEMLTQSAFLSDSQLAETYLSLKNMDMNGGILLDKNSLPKLNESIFQGLSDENLDKSILERAKIDLILRKLYSGGSIESVQKQISYRDYPAIPRTTFDKIKDIIENTNSDNLLLPLGEITLNQNQILLGNNPGTASHKPIIFAAHPKSAFSIEARSEIITLYKIIHSTDKSSLTYRKTFYILQKHFTDKGIALSEKKIKAITSALFSLNYANSNDYFFDSEFYGAEALKRTAKYLTDKQTIKSIDFDAYSSNTPEQSKGIKAYDFNKYELFGRASYDSLIYLKIGSEEFRITDRDYYENKSIPGRSVMYFLNPEEKALNLQVLQGKPLTSINRKTRIIITGHNTLLVDSDSQIGNGATSFEGEVTIAGASPEIIVTALKKIAPEGMNVKEINFLSCDLVKEFSNNGGVIREDSDHFIPQFLMAMKNNKINAIEVTASSTEVTASAIGKKIFTYTMEGSNKRKMVATPYSGRYTFRHDIEKERIYYYAKPGLSSYDPDISVIDPKLPNSNLSPGVFLNKKMTPPGEEKNILITKPEKAILELMLKKATSDRVIVTNKNIYALLHLIKQLKLAFNYASYKGWIEGIKIFRPSQLTTITAIEQVYTSDSDREAAFQRMKSRVQNGNLLEFYHLDIHTSEGAKALNYLYPGEFARISTSFVSGCRISRSPTGGDNCSSKTEEAVSNLNLLSGPDTELRINSANTDIALVDTSQDEQLAEFQQQYVKARREEARIELKTHRGYHGLIALDEASFTLAKNRAMAAGDEKTSAFLLKATASCGLVLLTPETQVKPAIEAGPDNPITLFGRGESLNAKLIVDLINELTPEGKITQLTLTGMTVDSLQEGSKSLDEIMRFIANIPDGAQVDTLVIQPLTTEAEPIKQLAQRIKSLLSDITPSIKNLTVRPDNNESPGHPVLLNAALLHPIPKIIHFSIINPNNHKHLLDHLKIWSDINPTHTLRLWYSDEFLLRKALYKALFTSLKEEIPDSGYPNSYSSFKEGIWELINTFEKYNTDQPLEERLESSFSPEIKENVISEINEGSEFIRKASLIKNVKPVEFSSTEVWRNNFSDIIQTSLSLSDSWLAERIIGLNAISIEGGRYFDTDLLPKINRRIFLKRRIPDNPASESESESDSEQDPDSDSDLEEQRNRSSLEAVIILEILKKLHRENIISNPQNYLDQKTETSVSQNELSNIKSAVNTNNYKSFFLKISEAKISNNMLNIGDKGRERLRQPLVLEALPNSPIISAIIRETLSIYGIASKYSNAAMTAEDIHLHIKEELLSYYKFNRNISLNDTSLNKITLAAFNLVMGSMAEYSTSNELMSRKAFERAARSGVFNVGFIEFYSSDSPSSNTEIKPYSFNKLEIFGSISYDSLIFIDLNVEGDLRQAGFEAYINSSLPEDSVLYRWDSKRLRIIRGNKFTNIGKKTKVIILGHGQPAETDSDSEETSKFRVENFSSEELADLLAEIIPEKTTLKNISFLVCDSAESVSDFNGVFGQNQTAYLPDFLRRLAEKGIYTVTATATNRTVSAGNFYKHRYALARKYKNQDTGELSEQNSYVPLPELTRYVFTLDPDSKRVNYRSKIGLASYKPDISLIDETLPDSNLYPGVFLTKWHPSKTEDRSYLYVSIKDFVKHALDSTTKVKYIVYANDNIDIIERLLKALKFTENASTYKNWLNLYKNRYPTQIEELKTAIEEYHTESEKEAAFLILRKRVYEGQFFHIYHLDPTTNTGASILNYRYRKPFYNILLNDDKLSCHDRRSRRSPTSSSCNSRTREIAYALGLLSGPDTQLHASADIDIALMDTSDNPRQALLQQEYNDIRRQEGRAEADKRRGRHNFIGADEDSFTRAKALANEVGDYARAFLLKQTPSSGFVLLSADGKVSFALEAGDFNGLTIVCNASTLTTENLTAITSTLAKGGKIKRLTLAGMDINVLQHGSDALEAIKSFITTSSPFQVGMLIVQPDNSEPESIKQLARDIEIPKKERRLAINIAVRSTNDQESEYRTHLDRSKLKVHAREIFSYQSFSNEALIPRNINIVKLGPLNVVDFVFLHIWKVTQFVISENNKQPLPVTLYIDSAIVYLTLLDKHIMESCKDQLIQTIGTIDKKQLKEIAFDKRKKIISRVFQSNGSLDIVKLRQLVLDEAGEKKLIAIEKQHQKYLSIIKESGINVVDIADPKSNPSTQASREKGYNLYSWLAYYFGNREMAERVIRSYIVINQGGLTIQAGVLPELNGKRLHHHILDSLSIPYENRSTAASLVRLFASILEHSRIIPPLNDDDRDALDFYQTPNTKNDSELEEKFFKKSTTSAVREKQADIIQELFKGLYLNTMEKALQQGRYGNLDIPIHPLEGALTTRRIDYNIKNSGVIISIPKTGIENSVTSRQLAFLETLFDETENDTQLIERLNAKSQSQETEKNYIDLTSQTCLKNIIQSGPYGSPVNQIDFLGKLLSRSSYKNEGSRTRGLVYSLSHHTFLYYDHDNQLPESLAHSADQTAKNKIIFLFDQNPDAVATAWEDFQSYPSGVSVHTPVYLKKLNNDGLQTIYGYHLHSGIPFIPDTETELEVLVDYSSIRDNIDVLKESIINFTRSIIGNTDDEDVNHSTRPIIKSLNLQIKHHQENDYDNILDSQLSKLKSLEQTSGNTISFQTVNAVMVQHYNNDITKPVVSTPSKSTSSTHKKNQLGMTSQTASTHDERFLKTSVNTNGNVDIEIPASAHGLSELMLFKFNSLNINSITVRSSNDTTLNSFKSAFLAAITIYNHSELMELFRTSFNDEELSSVKILNEKIYSSGVYSFYSFFSTSKGQEVANSIHYTNSNDQSLTPRDHNEKPRLLPEGRQAFKKNLRFTINPDGSLNLKVVADVYGLKDLMLFKLYDSGVHSIEAYSDNLQGWRGFKFALETAIETTKTSDFFDPLRHSFDRKELEPLLSSRQFYYSKKYLQTTSNFRTFFTSEKGSTLLRKLTQIQDAGRGQTPESFLEQRPHLSQSDLSGRGGNLKFSINTDGSTNIALPASAPALKDLINAKLNTMRIGQITIQDDSDARRLAFKYAFVIALEAETRSQLTTPLSYVFDDKELNPFHKMPIKNYKRDSEQFRSFFDSPQGLKISAALISSLPGEPTSTPTVPHSQLPVPTSDEQRPLIALTTEEFVTFDSAHANSPDPADSQTADQPLSLTQGDTETSDTETSDTETRDTETSDTETSDTETSDTETSDTETSDTETSDTETSDTETSDTETSDTDKAPPRKKARLSTHTLNNLAGSQTSGTQNRAPQPSPIMDWSNPQALSIPGSSQPAFLHTTPEQRGGRNQNVQPWHNPGQSETLRPPTNLLNTPDSINNAVRELKIKISQLQTSAEDQSNTGRPEIDGHSPEPLNSTLIHLHNLIDKEGKNIWLMLGSEKQILKDTVAAIASQATDVTFQARATLLGYKIDNLNNLENQYHQQQEVLTREVLGISGASCSSSGRSRRDTGCIKPDPVVLKRKINRFVNWLLRRSDNPRTIITLPGTNYPGLDIGAVPTRPDSLLARIQARLKAIRNQKADSQLSNKPVRGFHTTIALDEDSWLAAQQQNRHRPGTETLLYKPARGILLSPYGGTVTRIPGGAYNSLSFVGKLGEASSTEPSAVNRLNSFVSQFCHQESIGSVLLQNTDGDHDAFKAFIKTFTKRPEGSFSRIGSFRFKSANEKNAPEFILRAHESTVLRLTSPRPEGTTHPRLDPVAYHRLEQVIRLNGLKNKVTPPDLPLVRQTGQLITPNPASQLAEKRIKAEALALAFTDVMSSIYADHNLSDDYIPILDTLKKTDQGWSMDFVHPTTRDVQPTSFTSDVPFAVKKSFGQTKASKAMGSFSRNIKKLVRPNSSTQKGLALVSVADTAQMVAAWARAETILDTIDKLPWMSDSVHRSLQAQAFINLGLGAIEAIELVQDLAELSKTKTLKPLAKPGSNLQLSTAGRLSALKGATTGARTTIKATKSLKMIKGLKTAGKLLDPALSLASASLTTYVWSEIDDPEIKDLYQKMVIVEWTGFAVSFVSYAGPVGWVIAAAYSIFSMFFGSYLEDEMQKIIDQRTREAIAEVNKFFKFIYDQMDPKYFLKSPRTCDKFAYSFSPSGCIEHGPAKLINLVKAFIKDTGLRLGFQEVDLISKTLKMTRFMVDTYDFEAFISSDGGLYSNDETSSSFTKREKADLISAYLKSACKAGGRLENYGCQDGSFNVDAFLKDASTIVMPVMPDQQIDLSYIDSSVTGSDSLEVKKLFQEAGETNSKMSFNPRASVDYYKRAGSPAGGSTSKLETKTYQKVLVGIDNHKYLKTNTTIRLDNKSYRLAFPYSRDLTGKVDYHVSVPASSKAIQTLTFFPAPTRESPGKNSRNPVLATISKLLRRLSNSGKTKEEAPTTVRHLWVNNPQNTTVQWFIRSPDRQNAYRCSEKQNGKSTNCKVHFDPAAGQLTIELTGNIPPTKAGKKSTRLTSKIVFTGYWPGSDVDQQYRINIVDDRALLVISPYFAPSTIQRDIAELKPLLTSKENWQQGIGKLGEKILSSSLVKPFLRPEGRRQRFDINTLFAKVSEKVDDYLKSTYIKVQLLYSSHPIANSAARIKDFEQVLRRFSPSKRFLPVKLRDCPDHTYSPYSTYWHITDLSKSEFNCYFPDTHAAPIPRLHESYFRHRRLFKRTSLWFDTKHKTEIFLILPESVAAGQVIPVGGNPESNYFFYAPKTRRMYSGQVINKLFKTTYIQNYGLHSLFQNSNGFNYPVQSFTPIDKPETTEDGINSYLVTTEQGVAFTLSANPPGNVRSNAIYISTSPGSLDEAFGQLHQHRGMLPLYISDTKGIDDITASGFYDPKNKVAMSYLSSLFDFPGARELQTHCQDSKGTSGNWGARFNATDGLLHLPRDIPSNPCISQTDGRHYLRLNPAVMDTLHREHIPLHRFRQREDVIYVMLSEQSKDLYYARIHQPEAATEWVKLHDAAEFTIIALDKNHKNRLSRQQDGRFTHIWSKPGGILTSTDSGMMIEIPDESLVRSSSLASYPSSEAYQFDGWELPESGRTIPLSASRPIHYHQLPRVNGAYLRGLDLGLIAQKVYRQSFNNSSTTPSPRTSGSTTASPLPPSGDWSDAQAKTFIDNLKVELTALFRQFEQFGFVAPDLIGLPLVTELQESQLNFLKQQELWFDARDNTLLTLPANSAVTFSGKVADGLLATIKTSGGKQPGLFRFLPTGAGNDHPYCGSNTFFANTLPPAFMDKISPACRQLKEAPEGDYQWNAMDNFWLGNHRGFLFEISENHRLLIGYDLNSQSFDQTEPISYRYPDMQGTHFSHRQKHLVELMKDVLGNQLPNTTLASFPQNKLLRLKLADNMPGQYTHTAWYDSGQERAFIGPASADTDALTLIGSRDSGSNHTTAWCYNQDTRQLYQTAHSGPFEIGEFDELSFIDNGKELLMIGTNGDDNLIPSKFYMDTIYTDDGSHGVRLRTDFKASNDFSILLDGKQGADQFTVLPSDLRYFSQTVIILNRDTGTDKADSYNRIQIRAPSHQFRARRKGYDLILKDRFDPDSGDIVIAQAWSDLDGLSPAPTQLIFSETSFMSPDDRRLWLSGLKDDITKNREVLLPFVVDNQTLENTHYTFSPTPETPLLIDLADGFRATPTRSGNQLVIHFSKRENHGGYNHARLSITLKQSQFASGDVLIRQAAAHSPANRVYRPLQFDDSSDCHLCTHDLRLKRGLAASPRIGELRFRCNKPYPLPEGEKYIKCAGEQATNAGFPLITQKQLADPAFSIKPETRFPHVLRNLPEGKKRVPVYVVLYGINEPAQLRFIFRSNEGNGRWEAWLGQVLIRSGALSNLQSAINVMLINDDNKKQQHRHYRVIQGSVIDAELRELNRENPEWQAVLFDEHIDLGSLNGRLPDFGNLQPILLAALLDRWPGLDGIIMADQESNQLFSLSRLAFMLNHAAPVLIKSDNKDSQNLLDGNSLDNILYCKGWSKPTEVRGHGGNDLLMVATGSPVLSTSKNYPASQARDFCYSFPDDNLGINILKGGAGDDIYDLRAPVNARGVDNQGEHTVILSPESKADLRQLEGAGSLTLFLVDMAPEDVLPVLCDKETGVLRHHLDSPGNIASLLNDNHTLQLLSRESGRVIALLSTNTLGSIYFHGGLVSQNPQEWITGADQGSGGTGEQNKTRGLQRLLEGAKALVSRLLPDSQQTLEDRLMESEKTVYPKPRPENRASVEIYRHINTLVQSMSQFEAAKSDAGSPATTLIPTYNSTMTPGLNISSTLSNTTPGSNS
ncbi:C80 family cysteine peptidase [Endozoicomonas euniceicola]|uniref:C80 family cysteine peptidase n=1 Tax=Endozoicomonas euniceicola TaxID=1234143 RepID=A0ABY6GUQ0_9GAMM|nr:C80 family cysteine peptidase [Endozoicomonas euniceicola]UYM16490.1 C80 family cysteine peptidase [Endozoicomonas euniceicola]